MENSPPVYNKLEDSSALEITGKIMVSVMIILFFIIALFLFVQLYLRTCFLPRHRHDQETLTARRRRRRLDLAGSRLSAADRHRLDPSVLKSIPVIVFSSKHEEIECAVCLSKTVEGEKVRILPKCNHGFHVDCIDMWFESNSTCPICRNLVSDEINLKMEVGNSAVFPTNVLVFGNQGDNTSLASNLEEPSSSNSSGSNIRPDEMVVIEIPRRIDQDEETVSPIIKQLKSFKRLLSMGTSRASPSSSTDPGKMGPEQC